MLDWELSTLGDPLADFSYHLMQWVMPRSETGADTGSLVGFDLATLGIPTLSEYVDAYAARTGLDPRAHLAVYLAYNFFRLAAIVQGIVGRVRDGTATSEHAAARAVMVRPLAENGVGVCEEGGGVEPPAVMGAMTGRYRRALKKSLSSTAAAVSPMPAKTSGR